MGAPTRPAVLALVALAAALTLAPGAHARTLKAAAAVPGGATCPLTKLAVDAYYTTDDKGARVTRGTITLYNTGSAPLFIKEVSVQLLPGNEQVRSARFAFLALLLPALRAAAGARPSPRRSSTQAEPATRPLRLHCSQRCAPLGPRPPPRRSSAQAAPATCL